ncbi:MAG: hypothetical protein K8963_09505, partial [Proteobacteria bacterium]|nr:hypothetical protein [Pseudomonadota bacterium]
MSNKKQDSAFRTTKITYVQFEPVEMDRALTLLFPRLKYDGYPSKLPPRSADLTINDCKREFIKQREWFVGFEHYPSVLYHWIETDLMDLVNRGHPSKQAVAAPRPLHGNTYKFRNHNHARDYGTAEQIYWMLSNARNGQGQEVLGALKSFFFKGIDLETDRYDPAATVDVETQAILRLDPKENSDTRDTKDHSREPSRIQPLYIGQADIMADDILRLLAYESHMPRSVLVEYLKTLMSFHMALYHLRLLQVLPKMVKRRSVAET